MTPSITANTPHRHVLTDPEDIQWWAKVRGGTPARVIGCDTEDAVGGLRIAFPGDEGDETLEPIAWEVWFETLAGQHLALVVEE